MTTMPTKAVDTQRIIALNTHEPQSGPVLYVMAREQRTKDSWPLAYAEQCAAEAGVPLLVLFVIGPMFNEGTDRHNEWMIASLKEVEKKFKTQNTAFFVRAGAWAETVCAFASEYKVGRVVFDFNPLEPVRAWREEAASTLSVAAEMVDGRNIVPCWYASSKAEFAAHTFRPKIHKLLSEFLTEFPATPKLEPYQGTVPAIDWDTLATYRKVKKDDVYTHTFTPGMQAAEKILQDFLDTKLSEYAEKRNDPNESVLSNLSPYLRWGNISAQRVALAVEAKRGIQRDNKEAFLEELIVRRELTDNYVYYTPQYNTLKGAHEWAQKTLEQHRADKREYIYTFEEFEHAKTHDELWNAIQNQMVQEGKMHGWCRMYWAKKILEWTNTPEYAIEVALKLNDKYELDGRDSNGVVGVMWSIAGVHDRAWTERPVFGKIRYMNFNGAKRKFDVAAYIARYSLEHTLFDE